MTYNLPVSAEKLSDTCAATNPRQGTLAEVEQIFNNAL